ncbi:MAG: DUF4340 domain-containing protein [Bacteroidota bacterium]
MNRNKILLGVFGLLLIVFIWKQFFSSSESRNFREVLVELDTAQVTKINLVLKSSEKTLELKRTGSGWDATNGVINDEADANVVQGMLSSLASIKPKRLVAKSKDKWTQYEVGDSLGTKVQAYYGDNLITEFVVGKFNFQQTTRSMSTFVRLADEEDVYSVDGFLSSTFGQQFSNLRDKTFLNIDIENITSVKFNYSADSSFIMIKTGETWSVNDTPADSLSVQTFLNSVQNLTMREFDDSFNESDQLASYQVTFESNNMDAVAIRGFGQSENLVLHSSLNENAYFDPGGINVFEKLFVSQNNFFQDAD